MHLDRLPPSPLEKRLTVSVEATFLLEQWCLVLLAACPAASGQKHHQTTMHVFLGMEKRSPLTSNERLRRVFDTTKILVSANRNQHTRTSGRGKKIREFSAVLLVARDLIVYCCCRSELRRQMWRQKFNKTIHRFPNIWSGGFQKDRAFTCCSRVYPSSHVGPSTYLP